MLRFLMPAWYNTACGDSVVAVGCPPHAGEDVEVAQYHAK
jgi:hypothetical protein